MQEKSKTTRRQFLKTAGIATGAVILACGGLGTAATISPNIEFVENHSEGKPNMKKVLIAYSSKAGSTSEIAAAIGDVLNKSGMDVTVERINNVKDLSAYQAVVIGSLIRMGAWASEAKKFVENNKATLSKVPTAYFTACDTMKKDTPENRATVNGYVEPIHKILMPVESGMFAGKMDTSKLNFIDRKIIEMMSKGENPNADYRDWNAIKAWAEKLVPLLA